MTPNLAWLDTTHGMPEQAKKELVESYKRLRMEDSAPGSSTSYRITVRQLEALVRLSEALARLRCSNQIIPAYVREVHPHFPQLLFLYGALQLLKCMESNSIFYSRCRP